MPDAIHEALAQALIATTGFLELSDDDTVDADAAVKAMESAGAELDALDEVDRAVLAELILRIGDRQPPGAWRDFTLDLPRALGLRGED